VLLRGLAEAADLRLRVLVGADALDRPVDGVFTTDLLDPRRYLTGGEIVLTGLMWRRDPADSESFVAAVTAAGAVALAAGDAALGSVPDDLVVACRRHGLPLFEVPVDVSFAAITEQVLAARLSLAAGPGPAVARLRALAGGRGPGGSGATIGLAAVLDVAASEFGVAGWVLSAAGRLVAGAPAAPSRPARAALAAAWLGAAALPVTVLADVPYSLFGVTGEPAHRLAGWFLVVAGDQAGWDADRRAIAAELAAATAAHRAHRADAQRAVRRAADAVIGRLADRRAGAAEPEDREIAATLRRSGLAPGVPLIAVALMAGPARPSAAPWARPSPGGSPLPDRGPGSPGTAADPGSGPAAEAWPQVARVLLEEMLPESVAGVHGGAAVALASGGAAALDRFRDMTGKLAGVYGPGVPGDVAQGQLPGSALGGYPGDAPGPSTAVPPDSLCLAFGVSVLPAGTAQHGPHAADDPAGPDAAETGWTVAGIARALARARQARRIAALLGGGVRVVDAARLGSVELLLATAPAEARAAFRASLLSPLLDYDADHGTELVRTLRVFLDCSGSWTKAAETMFVHVNSLRYRMRRVEELTGRDLGSLADQAALLLALRLADPC
jgi:purine catabolism regulatory family protein/PucR-like helix-turn-helix protein